MIIIIIIIIIKKKGSQDGSINFWERETGRHVAKLHSHNEPSSVVLFNPRYLMFASADVNLVSLFYFILFFLYLLHIYNKIENIIYNMYYIYNI